MTVAEAMKRLAALPADTLLCFSCGDAEGTIVQATQIELVPTTASGDHYAAAFDDAAAIPVAVIA